MVTGPKKKRKLRDGRMSDVPLVECLGWSVMENVYVIDDFFGESGINGNLNGFFPGRVGRMGQ